MSWLHLLCLFFRAMLPTCCHQIAAVLLLSLLSLSLSVLPVQGQFFYHQALANRQRSAYEPASPYQGYATADAHPSVVQNAHWESELPAELSKSSRFYNDPVIAANLAKESLLTRKEMAVIDREAEKIPREQVYKLFKNAGYLSRR